jgi:hypothetical protein
MLQWFVRINDFVLSPCLFTLPSKQLYQCCDIPDAHGGDYDEHCILECDSMEPNRIVPTFRRNVCKLNVERNRRGLIWNTISALTWRCWRKRWDTTCPDSLSSARYRNLSNTKPGLLARWQRDWVMQMNVGISWKCHSASLQDVVFVFAYIDCVVISRITPLCVWVGVCAGPHEAYFYF